MGNRITLPTSDWLHHDKIIKALGEKDPIHDTSDDVMAFLESLGMVSSNALTDSGYKYFEFKFIKSDPVSAKRILFDKLLTYPPAELIVQLLHGVKSATRSNALSILKNHEYWQYSNETPLTYLLLLMNEVELLSYSKKFKTIRVIFNPNELKNEIPHNIFIEPNKPYSNRTWLKKILGDCDKHIYWIDKHFQKEALEIIWEIADGNKINEIKILSLNLGVEHISKQTKDDYLRLKKELFETKKIILLWFEIDSKLIRDAHDRWIICAKNAWNIPNVNAIISGQRSEINKSINRSEVLAAFSNYLKMAKEII